MNFTLKTITVDDVNVNMSIDKNGVISVEAWQLDKDRICGIHKLSGYEYPSFQKQKADATFNRYVKKYTNKVKD